MNEQGVRIWAAVVAGAGAVVIIYSTVFAVYSPGVFFSHWRFDANTSAIVTQNFATAYRLLGAVMVGVGLYRLLQVTHKM